MHHCPEAKRVLCATKIDLRKDTSTLEKLAQKRMEPVSSAQGTELAKRLGFHAYVETSALTQEGLKAAFDTSIALVLQKARPAEPDGREKCSLQ